MSEGQKNKQKQPSVETYEGKELIQQTLNVQARSTGVFANFLSIARDKTHQIILNIIGDYGYVPKNEYNYTQKQKILDYLRVKVITHDSKLQQQQKNKFNQFDPSLLDNLPRSFDNLRNLIMKARTNLDSANHSLKQLKLTKDHVACRYLNEQAFQFDKTRYNSIGWGLLVGSFINISLYRHGSSIRKAALFLTCGHIFGMISYTRNLDRYFDSVYPIFEKDAVKFSIEQQIVYKDWKPEGKALIEE